MTTLRIAGILFSLFVTPHALAGPLYDELPDSTVLAIYIEKPGRILPRNLLDLALRRALPKPSDAERLLRTLDQLPGPMLIGVQFDKLPASGPPTVLVVADLDARGALATQPHRSGDRAASFDELLEQRALPLLNELFPIDPDSPATKVTLERGSDLRRIKRGEHIAAAYAIRQNRLLACSDIRIVQAWLRGEFPAKRWVSQPGIRSWIGGMSKAPPLRVLFNPAPLVAAWPHERANDPAELFRNLLSPEDVRGVSADLSLSRDSLALDFSVSLSETTGGISRALLATPSHSRTLGLFPDSFTGIGRIAWPSAAGMIDAAYRILDRIGPEIGEEYRQELHDFRDETGVDFDTDVLANLINEIGFGVRIDFTRPNPIAIAVVFPLRDPPRFAHAIDKLLAHFGIDVTSQDAEGRTVYCSKLSVPVSFGVAGDLFFVADSPLTISELLRNMDSQDLARPRGAAARDALGRVYAPNTACLLVDLAAVGKALGPMAMLAGPAQPLLKQGSVGFAMTRREGVAQARLCWTYAVPGAKPPRRTDDEPHGGMPDLEGPMLDAASAMVDSLAQAFAAARWAARLEKSMANMRLIGRAVAAFHEAHKRFPADLAELVKANLITLKELKSAYDGKGPANLSEIPHKSAYLFRRNLPATIDAQEIIMAERTVQNGQGANFLFMDGHVEFIPEPKASELIALVESGAESIKR